MIRVNNMGKVELTYRLNMVEVADLEKMDFSVENYGHLVERNRNVSFQKWIKLIHEYAGETPQAVQISEALKRCAIVQSYDIHLKVNKQGEVFDYQILNVLAESIEQALQKVNGIEDYYPILQVMKITVNPWETESRAKLHGAIANTEEGCDVQG